MGAHAEQSIYRFRGASSFNMTRFGKRRLCRWHAKSIEAQLPLRAGDCRRLLQLRDEDAGWRCRQRPGSGPRCQRTSPELRIVRRAEQQQVALADVIEALRGEGYAYRDQAVLCTGNEKLSMIGQELERPGVPVLFLGSLFERGEVKDLLALLSLLPGKSGPFDSLSPQGAIFGPFCFLRSLQ
jgi:superfamily I DNA/RNA helicase